MICMICNLENVSQTGLSVPLCVPVYLVGANLRHLITPIKNFIPDHHFCVESTQNTLPKEKILLPYKERPVNAV
jgi:hypothetical protein